MRRALCAAALVACVLALAVGCGGGSSGTSSHTTKVIKVTFSGSDVTPNGDRIKVGVGQPIELDVTADKAGQIHVHSNPEQELDYQAGTTVIHLTPIKQPGLIEVESHALNKTIVQLEVS